MKVTFISASRHEDPGLQPERTDLAWRRTSLSFLIAATFFLRWVQHHGWFVAIALGASLICVFATNLTQYHRYKKAVLSVTTEKAGDNLVSVLIMTIAVAFIAIVGIYTVIFMQA